MYSRVTFRKIDDPKWERETSCDIPAVGDIIRMIPNAEVLDTADAVSYLVHSVQRDFIAVEFPGEIGPGEIEGTLLQDAIMVMLAPVLM